jgi:hypothetical protein
MNKLIINKISLISEAVISQIVSEQKCCPA